MLTAAARPRAALIGPFLLLSALFPPALAAPAARAQSDLAARVNELVKADEPRLLAAFKHFHANPELGFQEVKTSALIEKELRDLGYEVLGPVGKTGRVAILRNGDGPTVLFRADMDGLPVRERTGLPYASKATAADGGRIVPVMHACGHDAHMCFLLGAAKVMKELRGEWSGTLVLVAQPAEEIILGARAMIQDPLYKKVPRPAYLVSSHVTPIFPSGQVALREGRRMAGTDQIDVTFHGVGGHGSAPHHAIDPIVMAARAVLAYQTIISREIDPQQPAVLTVGAFQAGDANNVIPDHAVLRLNIRWVEPKVREKLIASIKRVSEGVALSAGAPKDRMPTYVFKGNCPPVVNDPELVEKMAASCRKVLGKAKVQDGGPPLMGSEDFILLGEPFPGIKMAYLQVGCAPPDLLARARAEGKTAPFVNHNPNFMVDPPAVVVGTRSVAMILLDLLAKRGADRGGP